MMARCYNHKHNRFERYGGRGIKVCERWHVFDAFLSDMGKRPENGSIERLDIDGDYEPSNCCWIPLSHQARNKRTSFQILFLGQTKPLVEWCEILGLGYHQTWHKLRKQGLTVEAAFRNTH